MIETVLGRLGVMKEEDTVGKRGTGDVDSRGEEEGEKVEVEHGGGDGEDTGRYAKDEEVSSNGPSVVETEKGMKLESRTPGEDVSSNNGSYVVETETESGMKLESRSPGEEVGQDQKLQQEEKHDAIVEDPLAPRTKEGVRDIRLVPDWEEGEEKCDKKLKNYAWKDSGAIIMDHSSALKGAGNLLDNSLDKYSISPCNENEKKIVMIALSEVCH